MTPPVMHGTRPRLLFVSARHLIPADSGGKIRTRDVLMGLKDGRFDITLVAPCTERRAALDADALDTLCDRFIRWPEPLRDRFFGVTRLRHLLSSVPIPVATDRSPDGTKCVADALREKPDVVVVDFPHAGVLLPDFLGVPSVLFTHNVEAEIFRRHADVVRNPVLRAIWRNQTAKMARFEQRELARYNVVIAIAERDKAHFVEHYGTTKVAVIPTGVNLDFYPFAAPDASNGARVMFSGSMDWRANIDSIEYFMDDVWPIIATARPNAEFTVIGRNPPDRLVESARKRGYKWTFTGFVDDVRPYVRNAQVGVIPLRIGGGTRLKVYESMAMGCPVVSTTIGVEGLPLIPERHYELADTPDDFARAIIGLIDQPQRRAELAHRARAYVEANFSHRSVARIFADICAQACGLGTER